MAEMTDAERQALIVAIAGREGTTEQLCEWYGYTPKQLRAFVKDNKESLTIARLAIQTQEELEGEEGQPLELVTPEQLSDLWITKKIERLTRLQLVADKLFEMAQDGSSDSTVLRELRAYMNAAAQELGQLLHRGSGESGTGDMLTVNIPGVDPESFR